MARTLSVRRGTRSHTAKDKGRYSSQKHPGRIRLQRRGEQPVIILRALAGVRRHFPNRGLEWFATAVTIDWGWTLLWEPPNLTSPGFQVMLHYLTEFSWAILMLTVGLLRLAALIVNGTFSETAYSRWSPHVRAVGAFISLFFWIQITLSLILGSPTGTGLAVYKWILVFELFNLVRCATDARVVDKASRNARH